MLARAAETSSNSAGKIGITGFARHFDASGDDDRAPVVPALPSLLVIPAKAGIQLLNMKNPCVYILASGWQGTLYIGVTSDLIKRIWEHRNDLVAGFTSTYRVHALVWFEQHATMESAIAREKAIKAWKRAWKIELIEKSNADWHDLYPALL